MKRLERMLAVCLLLAGCGVRQAVLDAPQRTVGVVAEAPAVFDPEAYADFLTGVALDASGDAGRAKELYSSAFEHGIPEAGYNLARLLAREGRDADALSVLEVLFGDPSLGARARMLAGAIHERAARLEEARRSYLAAADADPTWPAPLVAAANLGLMSGDALGAAELYRKAVALAPDSPNVRLGFAFALLAAGLHEEAVAEALHAAQLDADWVEPLAFAAGVLERLGRLEDAADVLARTIERDPYNADLYHRLAGLYRALGQPEREREVYTRLLQMDARDPKALVGLGMSFARSGAGEEALAALEEAARLVPGDPGVMLRLGTLYHLLGDEEKALGALNASQEAADGPDVRLIRAEVRLSLGDAEGALEDGLAALGFGSDDATLPRRVGHLVSEFVSAGEGRAGVRLAEAAVEAYPDEAPLVVLLGAALAVEKRHSEAVEWFQRALQLDPSLDAVYQMLGRQLYFAGRLEEAAEAFEESIARGVGLPESYLGLAQIALDMDDRAKAREVLERALAAFPEDPEVLNFYGYTLAEWGEELDRAVEMLERASAARPDAAHIADSLGWAYYKQGRLEDAAAELERSVRLASEAGEEPDPVIYEHLGDVYAALGALGDALKAYRIALEHAPGDREAGERVDEISAKIRRLEEAAETGEREAGGPGGGSEGGAVGESVEP